MKEVRESPKTLEEFEELSWPEKHQLKEGDPGAYWSFIWQIKNEESEDD